MKFALRKIIYVLRNGKAYNEMNNSDFKIKCNKKIISDEEYSILIREKCTKISKYLKGIRAHVVIECSSNVESILWMVACYQMKCSFTIIPKAVPKERRERIIEDCHPQLIIRDNYIIKTSFLYKAMFDNIVYILYTSGTTGVPKGIPISEINYLTFLNGIKEKIDFKSSNIFLSSTSLTFDISILETLIALTNNQRVVVMEENQKIRPQNYIELIEKEQINFIQWTPTLLEWIMGYVELENYNLSSLNTILIGGEKVKKDILDKFSNFVNGKILLCYGPTECTIWSMIYEYEVKDREIYLGKPLTKYYIELERYHNSNYFEVVIKGDGVSPGYISLKSNNFFEKNGVKCFRTGDLVVKKEENLVFISRKDRQIKINGFRLELSDVERIIETHDTIERAFVIDEVINGRHILKAFVKRNDVSEVNFKVMIKYLRDYLPLYAIPHNFFVISEIPRNVNGKIDYYEIKRKFSREEYRLL